MSASRKTIVSVLAALLGSAALCTTVVTGQAVAESHNGITCPADTHWDITLSSCVVNTQ